MISKKIFILSICILLSLIFGIITYFQIKGNEKIKLLEQKISELSSQDSLDIKSEGKIWSKEDIEYHRINAYIEEIKDNEISVKCIRLHHADSPDLDNRIIEIDEKTVFRQIRERDESEKNDNTGYETFERKEISLTDLKKGDYLEIVSEESLEKSKRIKASEVIVWKVIAKKL